MENTVVIAGGTGNLGQATALKLGEAGYSVKILSRKRSDAENMIHWNPAQHDIADNVVDGSLAVVNFCGAPIDGKRWNTAYKKTLLRSRIKPAQFLHKLIESAVDKPHVYIGASGVGIYGNSGSMPVSEDQVTRRSGFAADLAHRWESAHQVVKVRNVILRIGVVLAAGQGFIGRLAFPMRMGIFPHFGNGKQHLPWIHIADLANAVKLVIENEQAEGIYNTTAASIPLRELMREALKLHHWGIQPSMPRFVADIMIGEMAQILFDSCNPSNEKLRIAGFEPEFATAATALADVLKR